MLEPVGPKAETGFGNFPAIAFIFKSSSSEKEMGKSEISFNKSGFENMTWMLRVFRYGEISITNRVYHFSGKPFQVKRVTGKKSRIHSILVPSMGADLGINRPLQSIPSKLWNPFES